MKDIQLDVIEPITPRLSRDARERIRAHERWVVRYLKRMATPPRWDWDTDKLLRLMRSLTEVVVEEVLE